MIPLLIDASNISYFIATVLDNFNANGDEDMADALLLFVHRRHWLTSGFGVTPIWCMDSKPYWRRDIEPEYKANRDHWGSLDVGFVLDRLKRLQLPSLAFEGFEADDVAAAMVKHLSYDHLFLLTTDSDWMGMVQDNVTCLSPLHEPRIRTSLEAWAWLRRHHANLSARMRSRYEVPHPDGFNPEEIWRFKSIMGDASDNLPPDTPLCLISLFEPFVSIGKDVLIEKTQHLALSTYSWDPIGAQEFNQELPDQPFNPIRIEQDSIRI